MSLKKKFFITTTIASSLFFFKGQPRLWKNYFDVMVIANEEEKLRVFAETEGVNFLLMPMRREISLINDFICLIRFICLFIKERPYIVHGNTPKAGMLSMVAAWLTKRPVRIYMCHGLRYQSENGFKRKLLMSFEKLSCFCATKVICVSSGVKNKLIGDNLCASRKAKVIGYGTAGGVDINYFSRTSNYMPVIVTETANSFVFIFIGRIVRDKGVDELVKAFQRLCDDGYNVYLQLIGSMEQDLDPVGLETLKMIKRNTRIHALGRQSDVRPFLEKSNALILPSYREGVGQVLLEACCMDVPCIASDIIGCNEVIVSGVNGELVPPRNSEMLYQIMKEWVCNPTKVAKMEKVCRNSIVERYAQDKVFHAYLDEYLSYL